MVTNRHGDSVDITLGSYETAAQRYADQSAEPSPALCAFLDLFADTVGFGRVLASIFHASGGERRGGCRSPARVDSVIGA